MSNKKDSKQVDSFDKWFLISSTVILLIVIIIAAISLVYLSGNLIEAFSSSDNSNQDPIDFNLEGYKSLDL